VANSDRKTTSRRSGNHLVWTPIHEYIQERAVDHGSLLLAISPFIKLDALKLLVERCPDTSALQVIVRWRPIDIVSRVSDLEIYEWLTSRDIALYRHPNIHLKLLVFTRNWAFHTSGNITKSGLGLAKSSNIEVGAQIQLELDDWVQIEQMMSQSFRVDSVIFSKFQDYLEKNSGKEEPLPPLILPPAKDKSFSRMSLPASESPEELITLYLAPSSVQSTSSSLPALAHDLGLYDVPSNLLREDLIDHLGYAFRSHPFVAAIISEIGRNGSLRFGAVNRWLTDHCIDNPTPFRWELKEVTSRLYNWLAYFCDEITWDRPRHSQVIYWNER
jgi:hypothetical protein